MEYFFHCRKCQKSEDNEVDASVLPSKDEIAEALAHVNYKNIEIKGNDVRIVGPTGQTRLWVVSPRATLQIRCKAYLQKEGISEGIINLGGNVLTLRKKANGDTYSIGVQKPFCRERHVSLGTCKSIQMHPWYLPAFMSATIG